MTVTNDQQQSGGHKRVLNIPQLVALSFFTVSGGPYGMEGIAQAAPPFFALLTCILVPIFWSLPLSMITAELSCAMPEDGGSVLWISKAFGRYVGWTNAICSWLVFLLDSALYPTVILSYIEQFTGELSFFARWSVCMGIVVLIMCINLRSAEEVGWISVVMTVIALLPFVIFIGFASVKDVIKPKVWFITDDGREWSPSLLLSLIIWNSTGWEDVGMFAGEVNNPTRVFPRAVLFSLLLQTVSNVFPFAVGLCIDPSTDRTWKSGQFGTLAQMLGGNGLYFILLAGSIVSNVGLLHGNVVASSRLLAWLSGEHKEVSSSNTDLKASDVEVAPSAAAVNSGASQAWFFPFFATLDKESGVPRAAVVLNCVLIAVLTAFPFQYLIEADVFISSMSYVLLFITFVSLRIREPSLPRPFRLPGQHYITAIMYTMAPMAFIVLILLTEPWFTLVLGLGIIALVANISIFLFIVKPRFFSDEYMELR